MRPILFSIGNIHIYGYGLCMAIGMAAAVAVGVLRGKKYRISTDFILNIGIFGILGGLLGSKILFWIVELDQIIENPSLLWNFTDGFVIYGGVIGGALSGSLYVISRKTTLLDKFDLLVPSIAIGQAFGRIGCFLAGCCYGKVAPEGAWYAITFPAGAQAPIGVGLYPTQILSSITDFLIFGFLVLMTDRVKFRGAIACLYGIVYSVARFLIEFLRNDPRGSIGIFSTSQVISMGIFAGSLVLFFIFRHKNLSTVKTLAAERLEKNEIECLTKSERKKMSEEEKK